MRPESMDHKYLSATAASTVRRVAPDLGGERRVLTWADAQLESMTAADPDAIWVMQGWLFVDKRTWTPGNIEAYLSGVPDDRLVVLDLFSDVVPIYDQPNGYFGKRWVPLLRAHDAVVLNGVPNRSITCCTTLEVAPAYASASSPGRC